MDKTLIERIRAANPTPDVIRELLPGEQMRKSGEAYRMRCPLPGHEDKKPSFAAYSDRYVCFGCGEMGDVFAFVQQQKNLSFPDAAAFLAHRAGIALDADGKTHEIASTGHKKGHFKPKREKRAPLTAKTEKAPQIENLAPQRPPDLIPPADVAKWTATPNSNFFRFLVERADLDTATRTAELYRLGAMDGGRVVFVYSDAAGGVRTAKAAPYQRTDVPFLDCKRGTPCYLHPQQHADGTPWNRALCFFGEHLLPAFPALPVWIHESEKTAIVATLWELWSGGELRHVHLATGGTSLLSPGDARKWEPLRGRTVKLWPDADPNGAPLKQWTAGADTLRGRGFAVAVTDVLQRWATDEGRAQKIDYADVLLSEWDEPPEPDPEPDRAALDTATEPDPATDGDTATAERIFARLHVCTLHGIQGTAEYGRPYVTDGVTTWRAVRKCIDVLRGHRVGHYPRAEYLAALIELQTAIFGDHDGGPTGTA